MPLVTSTILFGAARGHLRGLVPSAPLSIHSIVTRRRESVHWLAILFTFALGTLRASPEARASAQPPTVALVAVIIALVLAAHRLLGLNAVLAFWVAYILTRPLGASIGWDGMSQAHADGGLGTTVR